MRLLLIFIFFVTSCLNPTVTLAQQTQSLAVYNTCDQLSINTPILKGTCLSLGAEEYYKNNKPPSTYATQLMIDIFSVQVLAYPSSTNTIQSILFVFNSYKDHYDMSSLKYAVNTNKLDIKKIHKVCLNTQFLKDENCTELALKLSEKSKFNLKLFKEMLPLTYISLLKEATNADSSIFDYFSTPIEDYALSLNSSEFNELGYMLLVSRAIYRGDAGMAEDSLNAWLYLIIKLNKKVDAKKFFNTALFINEKYRLNLNQEELTNLKETGIYLENLMQNKQLVRYLKEDLKEYFKEQSHNLKLFTSHK